MAAQLVAFSAQDVFLTGTPEISFWKVSYRRSTNYAREDINCYFSNNISYLCPSGRNLIIFTTLDVYVETTISLFFKTKISVGDWPTEIIFGKTLYVCKSIIFIVPCPAVNPVKFVKFW